jgi:hypothetical protein
MMPELMRGAGAMARQCYDSAVAEVEQCRHALDWAVDADDAEYWTLRLTAAERRRDAALRRLRAARGGLAHGA